MEMGGDQELIVGAAHPRRATSGARLGLYREPGEPLFDAEEIAFVGPPRRTSPRARAARCWSARPATPRARTRPGSSCSSEDGEVESATPGVERWLSDLPDGDWDAGRLPPPPSPSPAARGARRGPGRARARSPSPACSRARGPGSSCTAPPSSAAAAARVAVIVEPAHPARITPLLMSAYGLTEREQEVTRLVLQGDSTAQIAERLVVSPHTVQEHLKNIFEKTGVRSRRDLVGKVFFAHYEPRVRDNERRAADEPPAARRPGGRLRRLRLPSRRPTATSAGAGVASARISSAIARRSASRCPQSTSRSSARRCAGELGDEVVDRRGRAPCRR